MGVYSSLSAEELVRRCCSSGDAEAWVEFVDRTHRLIAKVVLRVSSSCTGSGNGPAVPAIDDLIQDTYLKFCVDDYRLLRNFEHRHPDALFGYIQVVAANVVRDRFRTERTELRAIDKEKPLTEEGAASDPAVIERAVLLCEVERHLDSCTTGPDADRNRRIFWLYYRAGLTASAIASLPGTGLSTKGVESVIVRLTRDLRDRVAASARAGPSRLPVNPKGIHPAQSL